MARYSDRLLADGERVKLRTRQHWMAPLIDGRTAWLILVASLMLVLLSAQLQMSLARDLFGWLGLLLLVVALGWGSMILLGWYMQDYLVTNRRVLKVEGILRKRSADSSLEKINDAVLEQSVFGRMLGYGSLDIMTASEETVDRYRFLAGVTQFKRTMLDQKFKLEQEVQQVPTPPLRAAAAVPAPAEPAEPAPAPAPVMPAPPVAPTPPSPGAQSADDITRALGDLADLRDRGALSPEEYEAKKQDLLGRL